MSSLFSPFYSSNFGAMTVSGGAGGIGTTLNPGDTSLYVPSSSLTLLPSSTPYILLLGQAVSGAGELVSVSATGSNPLTIVRAQESTTAGTWIAGTAVTVIYSAGQLANIVTALTGLTAQSTVATPANNATITTAATFSARVNPAGNVTGIILQAGTVGGQQVQVVNESSNTLTFAASGTSNVVDGTADIIAAQQAREYIWDSGTSLWYPSAGPAGAATGDHFIVGYNGQNDTDLTNKVVIPGLSASPDIRVAGTNDDEFDQNGAGTPAGWTVFGGGSPTADTNSFKSHLHIHASSVGTENLAGIYKAAPAIPYTVTAHLSDMNGVISYGGAVLGIMDGTTTGKVVGGLVQYNSSFLINYYQSWSNWTTFNTNGTQVDRYVMNQYWRIVVHSATNIDVQFSRNGKTWVTCTAAINYLVNATYVCLCVDSFNQAMDAYWDWIRFT